MLFNRFFGTNSDYQFPPVLRTAIATYPELLNAFAPKSLETTVGNLSKSSFGLDKVDNTADGNKPVSTQQQTAINNAVNKTAAGLMAKKKITTNNPGISTTTIIDSFASFTFKAGRNYKITWYSGFATSAANSYWNVSINTCPVADPAAQTTGMTQIEGKSIHTNGVALADYFRIEGWLDAFGSDTTLQVKFAVAFASSGTGTFDIAQNSGTRPGFITIEDWGSQI